MALSARPTLRPVHKPKLPGPVLKKPLAKPEIKQPYSALERREAARNVTVALESLTAQGLNHPSTRLRHKVRALASYIETQKALTHGAKQELITTLRKFMEAQKSQTLSTLEEANLEHYKHLFLGLVHGHDIRPLKIQETLDYLETLTPEAFAQGTGWRYAYATDFSEALYGIQTPENDHTLPVRPAYFDSWVQYHNTDGRRIIDTYYNAYRDKQKFYVAGEIVASLRENLIPEAERRLEELQALEAPTYAEHQEKLELRLLIKKQPKFTDWKGEIGEHYLANMPATIVGHEAARAKVLLTARMPHQSFGDTVRKIDLLNVQLSAPATPAQQASLVRVLEAAVETHTRKFSAGAEFPTTGYRKSFDKGYPLTPEAEQALARIREIDRQVISLTAKIQEQIDIFRDRLVNQYPILKTDPGALAPQYLKLPANLVALIRQETLLQSQAANVLHNYLHEGPVEVEFVGVQVKSNAMAVQEHYRKYRVGTIQHPEKLTRLDFLRDVDDPLGRLVGAKMQALDEAYLQVFGL